MMEQATKPPYVVMKCVGCGQTYKVGPLRPGEKPYDPYCERDLSPLYTVKAVGR